VYESKEHDGLFHTTAKNFGLLSPIEYHHAERYGVALKALGAGGKAGRANELMYDLWICKVISIIYDPKEGDPDSGIDPGTTFIAIPDDWSCPIAEFAKSALCPNRKAELKTA
jgi:rubredoxin